MFCYCQDHQWFRFSTRTSPVTGLALYFVAFTRATLVVLCRGENGTVVLSNWVSARKIENSCILGYWLLNVTIWGVCISILFCFFEAILEVCFFWNAFLENFSIFFSRRGRELLGISAHRFSVHGTNRNRNKKQKSSNFIATAIIVCLNSCTFPLTTCTKTNMAAFETDSSFIT